MEKITFKNLPKEIRVEIHFDPEEGFTAEVLDLPGCITEGGTIPELNSMINAAIIDYLDIPLEYHRLVSYMPNTESFEKLISIVEEKKGISLRMPEFFSFQNVDSY